MVEIESLLPKRIAPSIAGKGDEGVAGAGEATDDTGGRCTESGTSDSQYGRPFFVPCGKIDSGR